MISFLLISTYCSLSYEMPDFEFVILQDVFFDIKNILPLLHQGKDSNFQREVRYEISQFILLFSTPETGGHGCLFHHPTIFDISTNVI